MKLVLSDNPKERVNELLALGAMIASLHTGPLENHPIVQGWRDFLHQIYDELTIKVSSKKTTFEFTFDNPLSYMKQHSKHTR